MVMCHSAIVEAEMTSTIIQVATDSDIYIAVIFTIILSIYQIVNSIACIHNRSSPTHLHP